MIEKHKNAYVPPRAECLLTELNAVLCQSGFGTDNSFDPYTEGTYNYGEDD